MHRQLGAPTARAVLLDALAPPGPRPLPPISVVVCTRDRASQLERCLASLARLEYPAFEKPVMVADRGWYHRHLFAHLPPSRDAYLADLGRQWWIGRDLKSAARAAQIYAGFRFGRPAWQKDMVYHDDAAQSFPEIAERTPELLSATPDVLARELDTLRRWYASPHQLYHAFKMLEANDYVV